MALSSLPLLLLQLLLLLLQLLDAARMVLLQLTLLRSQLWASQLWAWASTSHDGFEGLLEPAGIRTATSSLFPFPMLGLQSSDLLCFLCLQPTRQALVLCEVGLRLRAWRRAGR